MMNFRTRPLSLLVLIVSVVISPAVIAEVDESTRQFDIELLIFRNLVGSDAGEVWPVDFSDWFEEPADSAQPDTLTHPDTLTQAAVTWLPKSQFRLTSQRNALARSAPYRPLVHLAWRQVVPDGRQRAKPVALPGAGNNPNKAYVDGLVRVAVERYLHLDLHLPASAAAATLPEAESEYGVPEIRLRQQRRMRSKELHYFDHPRFGVIALITPYEPTTSAMARLVQACQ
ncbi:MAG: CsiV family protein [Thiogranum sp.]